MKKIKYLLRQIFFNIKNTKFQNKIITFFFIFISLFTIIAIEYTYFFVKKKSIERLKNDLKNLTEIAYNEVVDTIQLIEQNYFSYEKGMEILKLKLNGPIEKTIIAVPKEDVILHLYDFFKLFNWNIQTTDIAIKKENDKLAYIIIGTLDNSKINIIQHSNNSIFIIQFPESLSVMLYHQFLNLDVDIKQKIIDNYQIRFIRNIEKSIFRIGQDGYAYILQSYQPEWLLPDTKFPEDYSLEKIEYRFRNNFIDYFNNQKELEDYLKKFGDTPEKQFNYIKNYMHSIKEKPDPAIAIVHPFFEFINLDNINQNNIFPGRQIAIQKEGFYEYLWENPDDKKMRKKISYLKYYEYYNFTKNQKLNWVIGIGAYEDESYIFIEKIRWNLYLFFIIFYIFVIILYYIFIKFNLTKPLQSIISGLKEVNNGNYNIRIRTYNKDEIGYIASTLNRVLRTIRQKNKELQNYASNLQTMVSEQTKQINKNLEEISKLKEIQDADYYLTYLLVKQLGQNLVKSDNTKIEFLIKQKKEFEFKNKKAEIGGDICIARSISLKENPYIFFLNADAMGKSMQGAAGSLILGSVMESILDRTIHAFIFKNYSPERWLKNSFIELKHIFESFKGSMGCTLFIGLLEEKTGTIYYINAEHPPAILFRNDKVQFINKDVYFQRLGVEDEFLKNQQFFVQTYTLKHNDILILGSDGKDDIKLKNGNINSDETLILKIIKETKTNLTQIYYKLLELGEITDDISLLKIHYTNPDKEKELSYEEKKQFFKLKKIFKSNPDSVIQEIVEFSNRNPEFVPALRLLIQYYIKIKDFKVSEELSKKYSDLYPADNSVLYILFYSLYKQKKYNEAIEYGERYYLRNPMNVNLLVLLAESYYKINNFSRSEYLIEKAISLDPKNEKIQYFIKKLRFS